MGSLSMREEGGRVGVGIGIDIDADIGADAIANGSDGGLAIWIIDDDVGVDVSVDSAGGGCDGVELVDAIVACCWMDDGPGRWLALFGGDGSEIA